jgi:exopolysaccharide biosynthesis polyprenyl glycosylphosphotransferase
MEDTRLDPVPLAPPSPFLDEVGAPARVSRRDALGRFSLLAADMLALGGSLVVVTLLTSAHLSPWILALVPLMGLLAKSAGLYDRDQYVLHKTTLDEGPSLLGVAAIVALLTEATQALAFHGRSQPLLLWAALTMALVITRATARFLVVRGTEAERILIVGDRATAAAMERKLDGDPALNALVVGRVPARSDPHELDPRALGTIDELPRVLEEHQVERVILAPAHGAGEDVVEEIRLAKACGVKVAVLPRLLEVIGSAVEFDDVSGQALLAVRGFGLSRSSQLLKRSLDVVCATLGLLLLSPLLLVLSVAVKRSSPGPVLFRQTRIGREGREFQMLKFRTMVQDADALKDELAEHNQAAPLFKIANDPRTTAVGRFLRRHSLDELPQLVNVLRGDMSVVGPRPLVTDEDRLFSGWQRRRYHVAPGITGPWQILGSSRVPVEDMVTLDYLYCASWSLWLDVKIIVRTIPYVLSRRSGEHTGSRL